MSPPIRLVVWVFLALSAALGSASTKANLILVTLDSARADRMGFLGAKTGLTPNLDRLAAESLVFEHAYAQAPGTVVSTATILAGAYPQITGMTEIGGLLSATLPYLPYVFKTQGYHTAAFVSSADLDARGLAQGFDRGFQTYEVGTSTVNAATWMSRNQSGPFFLWIHLRDTSNASYDSAIRKTDAGIGRLVAATKQLRIYAATAILVVADHGESLGGHGEETHGIFLYEETIHVPLLLKMPDPQPVAKRIPAKVRLVDIAPTLLEIARAPVPSQMQGQSLLRIAKTSGGADQPVYSRSELPQRGFGWSALESWRAGKYLYIRAPEAELYDLSADPGATRNLAQTSKATLDTMAAQLENFDHRFSGEAGKTQGSELSSSEMQKLASLGYVGLQKSAEAAVTVSGIDPKDKITTANKVIASASNVLPQAVVEASSLQPKANVGVRNQSGPSKPSATHRPSSVQLDRAIAVLTPIVGADPGLYLAQYTLGVALAQNGKHAAAMKHLHKAIEIQPDSGWAHYAMGASLLNSGDYKTAAVHLEIASNRLPAFAAAHTALAEVYEKLGRAEDARKERSNTTK
jgi:choline-sulfatase